MSNSNIFKKSLMAVTVAATLASTTAYSQSTTSDIRGNVVSEAGSTIPNATVTITHEPSGTVSTATTSANGSFSARGLRVGGPYTIKIAGSGFPPVLVEGVFLSLDQTFSLPVTVDTALTVEEVLVTGSQRLAGFANEGLSFSLGPDALRSVTTIDRDITDAALLSPFASVNVQSGGAKELSIAGANNRFNSLTIDGVALNDRFGLNANGFPTQRSPISYDAIESLSLQVAPFDVEYNGFTGGTINAVTKSGTNEFHGSVAFYSTDDSLIGDQSGDDRFDANFEEETFVATLGGPIIQDKLFFFVSYDKFEATDPLQDGPIGSGALDENDAITQEHVDTVAEIVADVWGFDIGGFDKAPVEDEKILANIDWNISDNHRAKFTYLSTEGNTIVEQNGNNFTVFGNVLGASSAWYDRSEEVESFTTHIFSDWTNDFSTQFKIASTTQSTGQNSLNGAEFPSFAVDVDGAGDNFLVIGPDRFRHGNELDQDFLQFKFLAEYSLGDHVLKAGFEREEVDVDNLFAQDSEGSYRFDSFDDLRNATASEVSYSNATTNDENDLRAKWGYNTNSFYLQDTWAITNDFVLDAGIRYDWYESEGEIRENQNFIDRYGYSNATDIDGLDVVLPRLSFEWDVTSTTKIRGGIGRFSGGSPGVWISNSYSNDGVISDSVDAEGVIAVPTTPDAATGQYIPADLLEQLATLDTDGSVNALSPDFEIPTTWKVNLGVAKVVDLGPLGEDWTLSADYLYNKLENTSYWFDQRCADSGTTSPDGRVVYDCSGPEAIVLDSVDEGESRLYAFSASKSWDTSAGTFDVLGSYTYANVRDVGYGTSSTATSNYSDFAAYDRQQPTIGTSNFEVEHLFKLNLGWSKEFFEGHATKMSLFAQRRPGQGYSYTFSENNNCVLDVGGGRCARESRNDDAGHLLYVPTGMDDPLFSAASFEGDEAAQTAFFDYIDSSELAQYKGSVAPRNGDTSSWYTLVNFSLQQELPGFLEEDKFTLTFDITNLGNLLNSEWGRVERTEYEYERDVVSASIDNGQYVYFNLQDDDSIKNLEVLEESLWQMQLGLKYEF